MLTQTACDELPCPVCLTNWPGRDDRFILLTSELNSSRTHTKNIIPTENLPPGTTYTGKPSLFVGCLTSPQHANVSQGRICTDNFTCCHTEIEAADPTFHLTQSQYTDTGPTSPSADPITPGAWQGSHWSANV